MTRTTVSYQSTVNKQTFTPSLRQADLQDWLCEQAKISSLLLAHAIDGVIWGQLDNGELLTSHRVAPEISPELRIETLQQLRLFNEHYEVKLWRVGNEWQAIRISDTEDKSAVAIDEQQLLWGTHAKPSAHGFIELEDGAQGLRHVIPPFEDNKPLLEIIQHRKGDLGLRADKAKPLTRVCLKVRHYLTENDLGVNTITISRLLGLGVEHYGQK